MYKAALFGAAPLGAWARRLAGSALLVAAVTWLAWCAGCGSSSSAQPEPAREAPAVPDETVDAAKPAEPVPEEPAAAGDPAPAPFPAPPDVEADAEEALAEMSSEWQAMLAKAEALQRRDQAEWCVVCHVDASDQWTGTLHDRNDVGCIECHGPSEAHAQDENNEVLPDEIFARADVDRLCAECHRCTRSGVADEVPLRDVALGPPVCTDCHRAHGFALPE